MLASESDSRDRADLGPIPRTREQLWSPFLPASVDAKTSSGGSHLLGGVGFAALLAVGTHSCRRNLFEAGCHTGGRLIPIGGEHEEQPADQQADENDDGDREQFSLCCCRR